MAKRFNFNLKSLGTNDILLIIGGAAVGVIGASFVMKNMGGGVSLQDQALMVKHARAAAREAGFPSNAYLNTIPTHATFPPSAIETFRIQTVAGLAENCQEGAWNKSFWT